MKLIADHITYKYNSDLSTEVKALDDVNLVINKGEFISIVGHTGSGKSTLVQHFNGLLKPTSGTIYYDGQDIFEKKYDRKTLRSKVGIVFQYPEHQLFAENVFEDVCFGPLNMGLSKKEASLRAYEALKMAGMDDDYFYQSPFNLSGGQKRRAAIAGVLAMKPEVLILDEPTAGLDPKGRNELLQRLREMNEKNGLTIILVSHSMEDVAQYTKRVVVMHEGKVRYDDTPENIFSNYRDLEEIGLSAPEVTYILRDLNKRGINVDSNILNLEEAAKAIMKEIQ